jgi:hypothetical protein
MPQFVFSLTLFISAALLFWIQLLTSKMILPVLGGSASVWNTCMMFFQIALLLGYLYAAHSEPHTLGRFFDFSSSCTTRNGRAEFASLYGRRPIARPRSEPV